MQRIIHTDRLVLRPAYIGDAGRVAQIMEYDISKWLIPVPDPHTLTDAQDWLSSLRFERGRYVWAISRDGEVIGMIGIDPTLGYWIGKEHWGQGYVREAAHAVLSAYFHDPFADPIYSGYFVENERSARVLTRLGFSPLGNPVAIPLWPLMSTCCGTLMDVKVFQKTLPHGPILFLGSMSNGVLRACGGKMDGAVVSPLMCPTLE